MIAFWLLFGAYLGYEDVETRDLGNEDRHNMGTWENGFGRCGKVIKGLGEDRQSIQNGPSRPSFYKL